MKSPRRVPGGRVRVSTFLAVAIASSSSSQTSSAGIHTKHKTQLDPSMPQRNNKQLKTNINNEKNPIGFFLVFAVLIIRGDIWYILYLMIVGLFLLCIDGGDARKN